MRYRLFTALSVALALSVGGCSKSSKAPSQGASAVQVAQAPSGQVAAQAQGASQRGARAGARAQLGAAAPDFTLTSSTGSTVKLSDYKGKIVVLEWFNPECPYVLNAHLKGSLVDTAQRRTGQGVVWLAVNSGGPGKQGHGAKVNQQGAAKFKLKHPVLLDESGAVGRLYGAERTPHMFVIDAAGHLVYRGAIDNSPDGEGESPEGGKLINYVDAAVDDLLAGRKVRRPETKAYGCGVKYGKS